MKSLKKNAPFVPTFYSKYKKQFDEIFKLLENFNFYEKKFVDLGSGNGKVVFEFAKRGYESCGVEINPFLWFFSNLRSIKIKNANFIKDDIFNIDLSNFNIVYLYQLTSINNKLLPKLETELKENSIIICHKFSLPLSDKIKLIKIIGDKDFLIYKKI